MRATREALVRGRWLPLAFVALVLASCGGRALAPSVKVPPRLTTARLGSMRCAMTYDGDWLGGMPPAEALPGDLELAARRGIEIVLDLRSDSFRESIPLGPRVAEAGLELVEIDLGREGAGDGPAVSDAAVDEVRRILDLPGRRRVLLIDDDGTLASMIYAIHLAIDRNVPEVEALRAARATGLRPENEAFVKEQVERLNAASL